MNKTAIIIAIVVIITVALFLIPGRAKGEIFTVATDPVPQPNQIPDINGTSVLNDILKGASVVSTVAPLIGPAVTAVGTALGISAPAAAAAVSAIPAASVPAVVAESVLAAGGTTAQATTAAAAASSNLAAGGSSSSAIAAGGAAVPIIAGAVIVGAFLIGTISILSDILDGPKYPQDYIERYGKTLGELTDAERFEWQGLQATFADIANSDENINTVYGEPETEYIA